MHYLVFLLFFIFPLFGEELRLAAESEAVITVANCVNVMTGDFFQVDRDIAVEGPIPLHYTRHYDSGDRSLDFFYYNHYGYGVGLGYPLVLKTDEADVKNITMTIDQRHRFGLPFKTKKKKKNISGYFNKSAFKSGYTNCTQALLNGEPSLAHTEVFLEKGLWNVYFTNGNRRVYFDGGMEPSSCVHRNLISREDHPNGLSTRYAYDYYGRLSKISLQNALGEELTYINICHHNLQDYTVSASNGLSAAYHQTYFDGKMHKETQEHHVRHFFLTHAEGKHLIPVENVFSSGKKVHNFFGKIKCPNGQFLQIEYDSKGRVEQLLAPLGKYETAPLYTFKYKKNQTQVTDALGRIDTYSFKHNRLHSKEEGGIRSYVYDWDDEGQLLSKSLQDQTAVFEAVLFQYDEKGKITEKRECGQITGFGEETFTFNKGKIIGLPEQRAHRYRYDERSRLIEEESKGLTIGYRYKENTNLVQAKYSKENGGVQRRHFYTYDHNALLVESIEDDGGTEDKDNFDHISYRLLTRITPQLDKNSQGFTKPKIKEKYYINLVTGEEKLLKRTEMEYTTGGLLAERRVYDANANFAYSESYFYDERLLLKEKKDRCGFVTRYDYDENRNCIFETLEKSGKEIYRSYDFSNRLIEQKEVHEEGTILTTRYTYDLAGNKTSITDHNGFTTHYVYDLLGRCIQEIDPHGHSQYIAYDLKNNPIRVKDKEGYTTTKSYNIDHQPLTISYPDNTQERFTYFLEGTLKTKWEKDGTTVHYTYDAWGRILTETRCDTQKNVLFIKSNSYKGKNLVSQTDERGIETSYSYDGAGRKIAQTRAGITETYHYDALGNLSRIVKGDRVSIQTFDVCKRPIEERTEDLLGNLYRKKTIEYDMHGNVSVERIYFTEQDYSEIKTLYNSFNLPSTKINGEGQSTTYAYTYAPFTKMTTDPLGQTKIETFDAFNRVVSIEIPSLSKQEIVYSPKGNKIKQIDSLFQEGQVENTFTVCWEYDGANNLLNLTEQGIKQTQHTYVHGRLHATTKPDGVVLFCDYDALGRLAHHFSSDIRLSIFYTYDLAGNLLCAYDAVTQRKVERSYDAHNQMVSETTHATLEYSYDALGRLTKLQLPDGSCVNYTYNAADLLSVTRNNATHLYAYDLAGRIVQEKTFDGVPIHYTYNNNHQTTSIQSPFYTQELLYNAIGHLIANRTQDKATHYLYNGLYQLTEEDQTRYTYDSLDNRLSKNEQSYQYNSLNQLLSDSQQGYTYDANGNRLTKAETSYTYDPLNHLLSAGEVVYHYDPLGRLCKRTTPTGEESFLYYKEIELGSLNTLKIVGKATIAIEKEGQLVCTLRDHRGSPMVLLDGHAPITTYTYTAFGETQVCGSFDNPWQYCGLRYDNCTKLLHAFKRFYDPYIGRWITPDPAGFADGPNLYAYVHNNPLTYIDPTGLFGQFLSSIGTFFGAFSRGFVDDFTWGGSEFVLGTYEATDPLSQIGYYAGMGASMMTGLFSGATEAKLAKNALQYGAKKIANFTGRNAGKMAAKETEKLALKTANKVRNVASNNNIIKKSLPEFDKCYIPKSEETGLFLPLPRNSYGQNVPSSSTPHTQLGYRSGRNGGYRQTREWGYNGNEIKTTDWTTHGRGHPYPHDHYCELNPSGGTYQRGPAEPFRWPND